MKTDLEAGRRARCPHCQEAFVVEFPATNGTVDEPEIAEERFSEDELPRKKNRRRYEEPEEPSAKAILATIGRGFLMVFDFGFKHYYTPWIIRVWWAMFLIGCVVALMWFTFAGPLDRPLPPPPSSLMIGLLRVYLCIWFVLTVRMICEFFIVLFDISEQTKEANRRLKRLN
jgi:hypothetical protein